ncbi:hypothetical protein EC844_110108 [Acinetobacter calcoaceticus]|uniref:Lipoprotein n=1 Tax=Acinetobacter calcoaceticus TaxID=471 RepID=A0A4R1XRU5_ACICA|nr:hypothetical protein EC844_110108 [Acinetobacter calcoaceticus]
MKIKIAVLISIFSISITSCSRKHVYLTPSIHGYLYDAVTRQPLSNQQGYIDIGMSENMQNTKITNNDGVFFVPNFTLDYFIFPPVNGNLLLKEQAQPTATDQDSVPHSAVKPET